MVKCSIYLERHLGESSSTFPFPGDTPEEMMRLIREAMASEEGGSLKGAADFVLSQLEKKYAASRK